MADNSFGIKELNLVGSGTPKIQSPNNINLEAVTVAISTNATVGGNFSVSGTLDVSGISTFANKVIVGSGATIEPNGQASFAGFVTCTDAIGFGTQIDGVITGIGTTAISIGFGSTVKFGVGAAYSGSKIILTDRLGVTESGRFDVLLADQTYNGIGHTALSIRKNGSVNTLSLFEKNYSTTSTINTKTVYSGYARHNLIFETNNVSYGGKLAFVSAIGQWNFYSTYQGVERNVISFNYDNIGAGGMIYPTTNNAFDLGYSSYKWRELHVTNVNAGVVTATSFVGDLSDSVTSRWDVGANGSSHYTFTGPGGLSSTDDPTIYLARGQTYEFNVNASGHPFYFQTSSGAFNGANVLNSGDGVTNNGAAVGVIKFETKFTTQNTLYYVCQNHSNMNGTVVIYPSI